MKFNTLPTTSTLAAVDFERQTSDLLSSILASSPDAETKLRNFNASILDDRIDRRQQQKLRRIAINAATLLAVEKQLESIHFPVFSMSGKIPEAGLPASESAQLRAKKKNLRLWARRRLNY